MCDFSNTKQHFVFLSIDDQIDDCGHSEFSTFDPCSLEAHSRPTPSFDQILICCEAGYY